MTEAATIASISTGVQGPRQFQGLFDIIPFEFNLIEASIASAAISSGDIAVPGAALGDFVMLSPDADVVDTVLTGQVTAAAVVTVSVANLTGGASTAFASPGININGLVLKPKQNVFAFNT